MKILLVSIAALILCVRPATAQSGSDLASSSLQMCLLLTDDGTWTQLKLTNDQWERVHVVQKACKEECEAAVVKKEDNPISNADGGTALSELRGILTGDQYREWVAYCEKNDPGGKAPK